jgi:ribosomal protein S14
MTLSNKGLGVDTQTILKKIAAQKTTLPKTRSLSKYKNFCLFSGKGRTYNRVLLIARHQTRKLINIGALPGISK